jgi:hypothetical protein
MKFDQEFPQPEHLLKIFSRKGSVLGQFADLGRREFHVCREPVWEGENI